MGLDGIAHFLVSDQLALAFIGPHRKRTDVLHPQLSPESPIKQKHFSNHLDWKAHCDRFPRLGFSCFTLLHAAETARLPRAETCQGLRW